MTAIINLLITIFLGTIIVIVLAYHLPWYGTFVMLLVILAFSVFFSDLLHALL